MGDFVIEQCLPSDRAAEIQDLFRRAGQPAFATVYDRVYTVRQPLGLRSWVAMAGGMVALHISVSIESFSNDAQSLTGGLLGDLMADEGHRDFWSPIKLAKRMVADVRKNRAADFLLTSFLPAAEGVFRATGFKPFGELRRHVLPLNWPYPLVRKLLHGEPRPHLDAIPFDPARQPEISALRSPGVFRPVPGPTYYSTRMPRQEYPTGTWLVSGPLHAPSAAVLVSPKSPKELLVADVLWRDANPSLAGLLSAVARWAARAGYLRLSLTTLSGSSLAIAAARAGFLVRPDPYPLMLLPLSGPERIPPPDLWSLTPFALTAW